MKTKRGIFFVFIGKLFISFLFTRLLCTASLYGQWRDDFDLNLEAWQGSKSFFCMEGGFLKSCGPKTSSFLYLSRSLAFSSSKKNFPIEKKNMAGIYPLGDSVLRWEWGIDIDFLTSSTNFFRLYLCSTDTAFGEDSLQRMYYLQLGEKGSKNRFRLFFQKGDTTVEVWAGSSVYASNKGCEMRLRVELSSNGCLKIYTTSSLLDSHWKLEADSIMENIGDSVGGLGVSEGALYSGLSIKYSNGSRYNKYNFDYVLFEKAIRDTVAAGSGGDSSEQEQIENDSLVEPKMGDFLFSEILFDVPALESKFVEIYNASNKKLASFGLALGVWVDKELKWSRLTTSMDTSSIMPGFYRAFAKDASKLSLLYTSCSDYIQSSRSFPSLDVQEGNLCLGFLSKDTLILDKMYYNKNMHHLLLPSVKGISLERIRFDHSAMEANNWHSAAQTAGYATPGCVNSQYREDGEDNGGMGKYFTLSSSFITPNNDGLNDYLEISWNKNLQGYFCSILIFDSYGRSLCVLAKEVLLGSSGHFIYAGIDAKGSRLRAGIYIVLVEISRKDGKRKYLRYALAIA
ncbi:MAG: hypothetical protein RR393_03280 [Bacteroidales bacterium]